MWVYVRSEPGLWTVGFHDPDGGWHTDSDHGDQEAAAERCAWLNGSRPAEAPQPRVLLRGHLVAFDTGDGLDFTWLEVRGEWLSDDRRVSLGRTTGTRVLVVEDAAGAEATELPPEQLLQLQTQVWQEAEPQLCGDPSCVCHEEGDDSDAR